MRDLISLYRQQVGVATLSCTDGYGEPIFGNDVLHKARVVGRNRMVRDMRGEQVLSTKTVYFAYPLALEVHDRITLSTADAGSTEDGARRPPIVSVATWPDDAGHVEMAAFLA